jgi:hypothetical protein
MKKHHEFALILDVLGFSPHEEAGNLPSDEQFVDIQATNYVSNTQVAVSRANNS